MRLICPNCGAQYEVAEDMIPSAGRDVQCSSCAHTWFETPGASEAREAGLASEAPADPVEVAPAVAPQPAPVEPDYIDPTPEPAPQPTASSQAKTRIIGAASSAPSDALASPDPVPEPNRSQAKTRIIGAAMDTATDSLAKPDPVVDEVEASVPADEIPARQPLPTSVSDILREEAAREEAKRSEEASGTLESQPDLGLDDAPLDRDAQLAEEARRRMARLKGEAAPAIGAVATAASGARSELLPDVEEINSSLRSDAKRADKAVKDSEKVAKPKSGFRRGFMIIILLALLALLVYVFAPRIAGMVPALEQPLDQYVSLVDQARLWLDLRLQGLLGDAEG